MQNSVHSKFSLPTSTGSLTSCSKPQPHVHDAPTLLLATPTVCLHHLLHLLHHLFAFFLSHTSFPEDGTEHKRPLPINDAAYGREARRQRDVIDREPVCGEQSFVAFGRREIPWVKSFWIVSVATENCEDGRSNSCRRVYSAKVQKMKPINPHLPTQFMYPPISPTKRPPSFSMPATPLMTPTGSRLHQCKAAFVKTASNL